MRRLASLAAGLPWVALFGLALWFRVSSLESFPGPNGDEAFYGVQAERILRGEPFAATTPNHNPLNPFHTGVEVALLAVFRPGWWILRAPSTLASILAVVLAYVLMTRALDRPTAIVFAALMATLPPAIIYSRTGYDCSQAPLFGVLVLYFALRGGWVGLILSMVAAFLAHPTNIFLLPLAFCVTAVNAYREHSGDPARLWRWVAGVEALAIAGLSVGVVVLMRPRTHLISQVYKLGGHGDLGFRRFARTLDRALLGTAHLDPQLAAGYDGIPFGRFQDRAFWVVVPILTLLGGALLARRRQWDRLAVVVGLGASVAAFRVVAGPNAMETHNVRYGLFLLAPFALALACLIRALLVEPTGPALAAARRVQYAGVIGLCGCLLASVYLQGFRPLERPGGETIWTFTDAAKNPYQVAATTIARDVIRRKAAGPVGRPVIASSSWWDWNPVAYKLTPDPGLETRYFDTDADRPAGEAAFRAAMAEGGYAVGFAGNEAVTLPLGWFPGAEFQRWEVPHDGTVSQLPSPIVVLRLKHPPGSEIASAPSGVRR